MDKWTVATKRQAVRALYEDAAEVMAEECGWRSESRCMTLFLLNPNTCREPKPFVHLPKDRPARSRAGLALENLEAPSGKHVAGTVGTTAAPATERVNLDKVR